ncbi:hypothetical protein U8527_09055 [Kordia algicida OT-1]|uniref:Uncharacterized protein n=1 Tax=Kordia algicida OT-1 TaxID=391587 RepID=A9DU24_9FLAO|nr:hypothetical protein [Kordia algicida]EDP96247.1 hypothetical protein KAOT1_02522 [Kordia algicida OT-1]
MKLHKGVQLFTGIQNVADQLYVNTGTQLVETYKGANYFEDSYIPLQTWRSPATEEVQTLVGKDKQQFDYRKSLYIGMLPEKLKNDFHQLGLHDLEDAYEVMPTFEKNKDQVKKINQQLHEFLGELSSENNFKFHKITYAIPNRETMTSFHVEGAFLYLGLHIDQSRAFSIHTAHKSGNRVCINLSSETRTLIYTNLTMIQVYNMLRDKMDLQKTPLNPDNIAQHFYTHYPTYPVAKIAVKPYQFYVAPTDNFFHDGSTTGTKNIDITMVYTGKFDQLP